MVIEKTIEVPKIQNEERTIKVPKVLHTTVDTVVQNQVETIEVVKPTVVGAPSGLSSKRLEVHKVVQRKKPVIQEQVQHVPKAGGKQFGLLSSEVMFSKCLSRRWSRSRWALWQLFMCVVQVHVPQISTSMRWWMSLSQSTGLGQSNGPHHP